MFQKKTTSVITWLPSQNWTDF